MFFFFQIGTKALTKIATSKKLCFTFHSSIAQQREEPLDREVM